ncbi:hypothetical protein [Streptomyces sp. NPDC093097]|uniref:hypothetical protein n=1 Tax=Streptomyces sp. NPDC093097 TaxID=3366027 RepID=UPI0038189878
MTDVPEPGQSSDDLTRLIPTVIANEGADPEIVAIGERYWALAGFAPGYDTPLWCEKTNAIDTAGWGNPIHAVAAAGVRAVVPDHHCSQCDGPLSLTSRTAFQQLCNGEIPDCVDCNESVLLTARAVSDPKRKAKREAQREAAEAKAAAQQAREAVRTAWTQTQRSILTEEYALTHDSVVPQVPVKEMTAALALLRYAPSTAPISDVGAWLNPLHPKANETASMLGALVRCGLLKIHSSSPATAFVWEPASFDEALRAADGDPDSIEAPELTDQFYPSAARFYAPFGTSPGTGAEQLDEHLVATLNPAGMTAGQQDDLLALAEELLAEEAVRYFLNRLEVVNLPAVTDTHLARLRDAAYKVARNRPLGEIYNLVWRATRAAAEAAQKTPRAPRVHMSTHAVNQFEAHAQRAAAEPDWDIKPFEEIANLGPAAMTRALFYNVLDLHPIQTSVPDIQEALPPAAAGRQTGGGAVDGPADELSMLIRWAKKCPHSWEPADVTHALDALCVSAPGLEAEVEQRVVHRAARRLRHFYERLAPVVGDREAALAVLAATDLLFHPVYFDGENSSSGQYLLSRFTTSLLGLEEEADDGE